MGLISRIYRKNDNKVVGSLAIVGIKLERNKNYIFGDNKNSKAVMNNTNLPKEFFEDVKKYLDGDVLQRGTQLLVYPEGEYMPLHETITRPYIQECKSLFMISGDGIMRDVSQLLSIFEKYGLYTHLDEAFGSEEERTGLYHEQKAMYYNQLTGTMRKELKEDKKMLNKRV